MMFSEITTLLPVSVWSMVVVMLMLISFDQFEYFTERDGRVGAVQFWELDGITRMPLETAT